MSVARNASATTSLPNPAALTPAGNGRSNVDSEPPLAGCAFALSLLLLDTVFGWSSTARRAERRHPTGLRDRLQIPPVNSANAVRSSTYTALLQEQTANFSRFATRLLPIERLVDCLCGFAV